MFDVQLKDTRVYIIISLTQISNMMHINIGPTICSIKELVQSNVNLIFIKFITDFSNFKFFLNTTQIFIHVNLSHTNTKTFFFSYHLLILERLTTVHAHVRIIVYRSPWICKLEYKRCKTMKVIILLLKDFDLKIEKVNYLYSI